MTPAEIAALRELFTKGTPQPWNEQAVLMVLKAATLGRCADEIEARHPHDAKLIAAMREALPKALDEIERLRASLLDLSDVVWMHADWLEHAGYDGSRDDADRLRVEVRKAERLRKMITDLGLDPDAGVAK